MLIEPLPTPFAEGPGPSKAWWEKALSEKRFSVRKAGQSQQNQGVGAKSRTTNLGPFGEVIRATGPMAKVNPFRFSTKYQDDESDLVYYGMRYLKASSGGWVSRDPIDETGFKLLMTGEGDGDDDIDPHTIEGNPYRFVKNDPISRNDGLGLWPSASPWYGRFLNSGFAIPTTHENSDARVLTPFLAAGEVGIVDAASVFVDDGQGQQGTALSYQHAMRAPGQSKAAARAAANAWVTQNLKAAQNDWCTCGAMNRPVALWFFGMALHTVQDSTSPAHHGFQVWHGRDGGWRMPIILRKKPGILEPEATWIKRPRGCGAL